MKRLLVPSSALLWGLQLAFLSPALALILVDLYGATTAEVGWVLVVYNARGSSLPSWCPRTPTRSTTIWARCWSAEY